MSNLNPQITFQLNLTPDLIGLLHPDRSQTDQDVAVSQMQFRTALIDSYIPGLRNCENVEFKSATTFVVSGEKAHYILRTYAVPRLNQPPIVSVVGWAYSDGTTLPVGTVKTVNKGNYPVGTVTIQNAQPVVNP